jgi:hypothetical protein
MRAKNLACCRRSDNYDAAQLIHSIAHHLPQGPIPKLPIKPNDKKVRCWAWRCCCTLLRPSDRCCAAETGSGFLRFCEVCCGMLTFPAAHRDAGWWDRHHSNDTGKEWQLLEDAA